MAKPFVLSEGLSASRSPQTKDEFARDVRFVYTRLWLVPLGAMNI